MKLHQHTTIALVSVRMDLGSGRRGVDMGPSAIRIAGLTTELREMGYTIREAGTVHTSEPESVEPGESVARYVAEIAEACRRTAEMVRSGLAEGQLPLILGGDHSLAMGSVAGVADHYRARGQEIGLIWVDAHTDMNTPETSPSGNVHGMPLAVLTGRGPGALTGLGGAVPTVSPKHVSIIAARDVDSFERNMVRDSGVRVFTMSEVDERGIARCMDEAVARACDGTAGFHLSFDLDSIDPMIAPGVGTPVPGGLTYREAHLVCEKAARSGKLLSLDMVEVNPVLDERNGTAQLAVGLVASALGKTIL